MSRSLGIPVKLLHEAAGHVVTVELKTGEVYRGSMVECEDNWNCQLENITFTAKDGKVSQLEHVFIRGSRVRARDQLLESAVVVRSQCVLGLLLAVVVVLSGEAAHLQ
ncbi:unnamed protein product [Urochloa humidicola]